MVAQAFNMLGQILQISFPAQQAPLLTFVPKLSSKLQGLISKGVSYTPLNVWLRSVFIFMAKPITRLSVADTTFGVDRKLQIDEDQLGLLKSHNALLDEAIVDAALSRKHSRRHGTGRGQRKRGRGNRGKSATTQEPDESAESDESEEHEDGEPLADRTALERSQAPQEDEEYEDDPCRTDSEEEAADPEEEAAETEEEDADSDASWGSWDPDDNPAVSHGFHSRREYEEHDPRRSD